MSEDSQIKADAQIDLLGESCPMNFVRAKLKLETMSAGSVLEVLIDSGDGVKNVPNSLKEEGHEVLKMEEMENGYRLLVKHK